MVKKVPPLILSWTLIVVATWPFLAGTASSQDARSVLQAVLKAIGADGLRAIQYSGTGWVAAVGQSFTPDHDWPRFEVVAYSRTIEYDSRSSREDLTRRQGNYPNQGGGGQPLTGDQRQVLLVSGDPYAWNMQGETAIPAPAAAERRQLDIWLTPHGFLKAALAAEPMALSMTIGANRVTIVSFRLLDKYRVNGTITPDNLIERVQTWVPDPVLGDMVYEHRYTEYKDFGGVRFPTVLHSHQGDPRLNPGHNSMEIRVTNVAVNPPTIPVVAPDAVRQATLPAVRAESRRLADSVWLMGGGSHHSVAVEFRDFVAVVEAPQDERRSLAVIGEVQRLVPEKPIQYVVNTHHHFDHAGGLRTYVAHGATVVTHRGNRDFFEQVMFSPAPRTLNPDILSTQYPWFSGNRLPAIESVNQKFVLSDGVRTMDLYHAPGPHNANMLVAYLPTEKILVNADLYSPPRGAFPPINANIRSNTGSLYQNIQRLKLDVVQHVPIHGEPRSHEEFLKVIKAAGN